MHNLASYVDTNTLNCKINYHLQWDQKLCIFLEKDVNEKSRVVLYYPFGVSSRDTL